MCIRDRAGYYGFDVAPTMLERMQQEAALIAGLAPAAPPPADTAADQERSLVVASVAVAVGVFAGSAMIAGVGAAAVTRRRRSAARATAAGVADMV